MPTTRRAFLASSLAPSLASSALALNAAPPRPNFLFVLADDLGWADLACYGSAFYETPNLDRLAASGLRFTNAYSAGAVCSPTRSAIMTGRYPCRAGITDYLPGLSSEGRKLKTPDDLDQLPLDRVTFAEVLKQNGYQTFYSGKWHLGGDGFSPREQGFDEWIEEGKGKQDPTGGERYTQGALRFLNGRDKAKPFFAFVSYNEVHTPITPREPWVGHFREKASALPKLAETWTKERDGRSRIRQDHPEYASMLANLDSYTGRLLSRLEEMRLDSNTVVVFASDNGGLCTQPKPGPTSNLPLRAGKGWLYEGGIRVPLMVRAPGVTRAGSTCHAPVISTDYFPTFLDLARLPNQPALHQDGASLAPLLGGRAALPPRTLYWHYPHYHGSTWAPGGALRDGDWKLVEFFEENKAELYRLDRDLGERDDLAAKEPARVKQLQARLAAWRKEAGAQMPVPR